MLDKSKKLIKERQIGKQEKEDIQSHLKIKRIYFLMLEINRRNQGKWARIEKHYVYIVFVLDCERKTGKGILLCPLLAEV